MKKIRKILAGLLGGAMVLTSLTTTAFAAETGKMPTIDTTKTGSITIHKYEYNGDDGETGTGENTDQSEIPEGAKALEGAGFTIYKVAGVNDLEQYYSTNPEKLPDVTTYADVEQNKIKSKYATNIVRDELKTDADGLAKFTNLELGFYVVIETTTPDKVTKPIKPFLVSVPMTTSDGSDWLYDVHVYPKNGTTYGEVTLEKTGKNNEKLQGVTFVLQKQIEGTWTNITQNDANGDTLGLTTNADGKISVSGLSQGSYRFIETSVGKNDGYILDGATTYEFEVTSEGKIKYNNAENPAVTISVKNEKPDMKKEVQDRKTTGWVQNTDYNIGDYIPYKITVDVPSNITKLKKFKLTDTPTNLRDIVGDATNPITVKNGENAVQEAAYTITATAKGGFNIVFDPAKMGDYAGKQLTIEYKAELLDSAVTTTTGNPNTAKLVYSNQIVPTDDADNPNKDKTPGEDAIEDNAIVYTFELNIVKVNESKKPLKGVLFDLYKEVEADTANAITDDAAKKVGLNSAKYWIKVASNLTTDDNGKVSKTGLANGTYYLVETKTNDGYNLLKKPVEVTLNIAYTTTTKTSYRVDENGEKTIVKHEVESTTFKENGGDSIGVHSVTVVNRKGFTLPKTGDMGTALFSIAGTVLMLGAVLFLIRGKKKAE